MTLTVQDIAAQLDTDPLRMGEVKKLAAQIKTDHALAMDLWATGQFAPRLVAVLAMDKKELTQEALDSLMDDMAAHPKAERDRLSEWLMAHKLMKSKPTLALLTSWQHSPHPTQRRLFWYHQARLRWTGQTPPDNTPDLLAALHKDFATEDPEVQWTMNFCAAWIGIYVPAHRDTCIKLGKDTGLYIDEKPVKGCTPNYLPNFIAVEVAKR